MEQIHPRRDSERDRIRWQESKRRPAHRKLESERLTHLGNWTRLGSGGQARESYRWPVLRNSKSGLAHKNETERKLTGACRRRDTKICRQQEKNQERISGHRCMNGNRDLPGGKTKSRGDWHAEENQAGRKPNQAMTARAGAEL
jgi:hypothetical protein